MTRKKERRDFINEQEAKGAEVALPLTIAELIAARARIIQAWEAANDAVNAVHSAIGSIHDPDFHFHHNHGGQRWEPGHKYDVKALTHTLDFSLFKFALHKLNITQAMTDHAREKFLEGIEKAKTVFCEKELVGLAQNAEALFRKSSMETVKQVYRLLIGAEYRSGTEGFRKKDNLQGVVKCFRIGWTDVGLDSGFRSGLYISCERWSSHSSESRFKFNDLLTACRLIEGKGFSDYSNNLEAMIRAVPPDKRGTTFDTGYFTLQAFKNRNVKCTWNPDKIHILERFNAIGAGREDLADVMRKRYKPEHFHDRGVPKAEDYFQAKDAPPPDRDKDFAFFATSQEDAARMVELAEYPEDDDGFTDLITLEPSAGEGHIVKCVPWTPGCTAIEFNHHRAEALRAEFQGWEVEEADFLKWEPEHTFHRILMNPPFNDRVEAYHVIHAWRMLQPGGILVAILPDGWFTRDDMKATIFRDFLQRNQHQPPEQLEAGSFKRTRVVTRIVTLKKKVDSP